MTIMYMYSIRVCEYAHQGWEEHRLQQSLNLTIGTMINQPLKTLCVAIPRSCM